MELRVGFEVQILGSILSRVLFLNFYVIERTWLVSKAKGKVVKFVFISEESKLLLLISFLAVFITLVKMLLSPQVSENLHALIPSR